MRHRALTYLAGLLSVMAVSCTAEKVYDWDWVDELKRPVPEEYDWFNDKWGLAATNTVSQQNYAYDGSGSLETTIETTSIEDGQRMLKYLDETIFPLLPSELIEETLPPTIYIVDKVEFAWTDEEYSSNGHRMDEKIRELYGDIGAGHLTLALSMLDGDEDEVKFNILSLVIERMMSNTSKWPEPTAFMEYGKNRIADLAMYTPYYQNSISTGKFYFNLPGGDGSDGFSFWSYCGSMRPCRYGWSSHCTFPEENDLILTYYVITYMQDFADILSTLILWSPQKIEEYLESIDGKYYERESSVSGHIHLEVDREGLESKMDAVRNYMKDNFGTYTQFNF